MPVPIADTSNRRQCLFVTAAFFVASSVEVCILSLQSSRTAKRLAAVAANFFSTPSIAELPYVGGPLFIQTQCSLVFHPVVLTASVLQLSV